MLDQVCPRCGASSAQEFYGPCAPCRDQLRAAAAREAVGDLEPAARFEPKMHVVANHVAASRHDT